MERIIDYGRLNEFRYNLRNKETGRKSYANEYCHGNIYQQIQERIKDLKGLCRIGVSNDTHEIISVVSLASGETLYSKE